MDTKAIAQALDHIALLLELTGENPFKVRAYQHAARAIESVHEDLEELVARDGLIEIKGVGRALADHIAELMRTGTIAEHEHLFREVPPGVLEMLAIPGLGPKKVRYLWQEKKLANIGELERVCCAGLIASEPGFGERTQQKILEGIAMLSRFSGRHRLDTALMAAEEMLAQVRKWPEVLQCEIAGSIRRRRETVHDIDILVATQQPDRVMERFTKSRSVESVIAHGSTKSSILLSSGMQCDLRAVTQAEYPFALHYFTGSKEHNVRMRTRAKERGLKLSEYGLFPEGSEKTLPCADEAALFAALDLDSIPPELREDGGEIEAASNHQLPHLVELSDLKGLIHAHTTYTDGIASIEEMMLAARALGFAYLVICDHSQSVRVAHGMTPDRVLAQHQEIEQLNARIRGFRVLKGIEVDILADGSLDFDDDLLSRFDVVVAAVHSSFALPEEAMTARIVRALSHPHVDILAHPTGRLLLARDGYRVDLKAVIEAAAVHGKAIEINAHPQRLDLDWQWCREAKARGVRLSIDPDAHSPEELATVAFGVSVARRGWLERADVLNALTADELLAFCRR